MPRQPSAHSKPRTTTVTDDKGSTRKIHLRRAHKKSHLGCKNCKTRRIKCDEKLPICSQCKRSNADCSYLAFTPEQAKEHEEKKIQAAAILAAEPDSELGLPKRPTKPPSPIPIQFSEPSLLSDGPSAPSDASPLVGTAPPSPLLAKALVEPKAVELRNDGITIPALAGKQARVGDLERRNLASTVAIARHGFETDFMREAYANWMNNTLALAYHHSCLFHASMAFSFGFTYLKTQNPEDRENSDRHRSIALREMQQGLLDITSANTDALLSTALILSWDVFLHENSIASYITLSRGLGAVLQQVQAVSSTTQMALCTTESLVQSIKTILHPRYDPTFFQELVSKIDELAEFLQMSGDKATTLTHAEYEFLVEYAHRVLRFLDGPEGRGQDSNGSLGWLRDPRTMFDFLRIWLSQFPCIAVSSLDTQTDPVALVLHTYYHAMTRALDAIFPEVRYLFQFSFVGPIDLVGPENCVSYVSDPAIEAMLAYPVRIISFFKKRQFALNKIFINTDPLATSSDGVPLYRHQLQDSVGEHFVLSFQEKIEFAHYLPYSHHRRDLSDSPSRASGSSTSTSAGTPLSQMSEDTTLGGSMSMHSEESAFTPLPPRRRDSSETLNSEMGSENGMPALSSMSMGMFKVYFDDRMDILQRSVTT